MIEISDELKRRWRARSYLRSSLNSFGEIALIYQQKPKLTGAAAYGAVMAGLYREFRIKNHFYEVV